MWYLIRARYIYCLPNPRFSYVTFQGMTNWLRISQILKIIYIYIHTHWKVQLLFYVRTILILLLITFIPNVLHCLFYEKCLNGWFGWLACWALRLLRKIIFAGNKFTVVSVLILVFHGIITIYPHDLLWILQICMNIFLFVNLGSARTCSYMLLMFSVKCR